MPQTQTLLKDKPYEFVPLVSQCNREFYNSLAVRGDCIYSGRLNLKITVISHLHIGSGEREFLQNGNVLKKQMRRNGKCIIPGSSLKGAVRSVAEAVSYSCAVKAPDYNLKSALPDGNMSSCSDSRELCMACYIFGMTGKDGNFKGKVRFGEFSLISEGSQIERRKIPFMKGPHMDNERLYYCKACTAGNCENCTIEAYDCAKNKQTKQKKEFRGRKFYSTQKEVMLQQNECSFYEMIKPGSVLKGEIVFQDLRQEEGRLLAYALNIGNFFCMKLGYGKPLGYGKVKIELESAESINSKYVSLPKIDSELVQKWANEYREENTDEIKLLMSELERIMRHGKKEPNIVYSY